MECQFYICKESSYILNLFKIQFIEKIGDFYFVYLNFEKIKLSLIDFNDLISLMQYHNIIYICQDKVLFVNILNVLYIDKMQDFELFNLYFGFEIPLIVITKYDKDKLVYKMQEYVK